MCHTIAIEEEPSGNREDFTRRSDFVLLIHFFELPRGLGPKPVILLSPKPQHVILVSSQTPLEPETSRLCLRLLPAETLILYLFNNVKQPDPFFFYIELVFT